MSFIFHPPFRSLVYTDWLVLGLTAVLAVLLLTKRHYSRNHLPLPPGPQPLPVLGNISDLPKSNEWLQYARWGDVYGPIVHIRLFQRDVIILNKHQDAIDLIEKNSTRYADRPRSLVMAGELMGWNRGVSLSPAGPRHRSYRKLLNTTLGAAPARTLWPLQQSAAYAFLRDLSASPDQFLHHIRRSVGTTIVAVTFGNEGTSEKDMMNYIERQDHAHLKFSRAATPYAYAVDFVPLLKYVPEWFPGAGFKKFARIARQEVEDLVREPYERTKLHARAGSTEISYVKSCLDAVETPSPADDETISWTAASLYTGGADTTIAGLSTFFYAMVLHPHVQAKAQEELDRVIGTDRLPTMADRPDLPCINACIKELLRWNAIAPIGIPHHAQQDDEFHGYFIPEGTTIITNIWGMMRDAAVYAEPEKFHPERFLPPSNERDCTALAFGFGRRVCPGMHMADSSLFIYIASTLAAFNIHKRVGADGKEVELNAKFVSGVISGPEPFECSITPRPGRGSVDKLAEEE